ncbi:MAG TPA: erythromycin esterase family protein, partial [Chloroflexaceae bacterium]|nr:erythromycin esterase family protein [Chloroflexaceae bacterium]
EAFHGGEELLLLRNRLFARLVTTHGYRALAIESSFPRAEIVNAYIAGHGPATYEAAAEAGFSHGFGQLAANRELVEWMRAYNRDPSHVETLRFYGFDMPTGTLGAAGPRQTLDRTLAFLAAVDSGSGVAHRQHIEALLGEEGDWDNPTIFSDRSLSPGGSPQATALRAATEDLISELRARRLELDNDEHPGHYAEAMLYATMTRQLLGFHAAFARGAGQAELLGIRDALMADNLAFIAERERGRGKVLVFAHNAHVQRGKMTGLPSWRQPRDVGAFSWWPAGAHMDRLLGERYAVIGTALGVSAENGIASPEPGTLEALLTSPSASGRLIPTHRGVGFATDTVAALPTRAASDRNRSYVPLSPQSFTDFDWLAVLDSATYSRGGRPLPE